MQLAAELGVLGGDVENWLAGRAVPSPDACRRLARYLGVPEAEIGRRCDQ